MKHISNQATLDTLACRLAKEYLLGFDQVNEKMLQRYLTTSDDAESATSLPGIYRRLVISAQNRNMSASVVGGSIGGVEKLGKVLCRFHPAAVVRKYGMDSRQLLNEIVSKIKPAGRVRRNPRSIWPLFCRSILSGATFLSQFKSAKDFCEWATFYDSDDRARAALPLLLAQEIDGFGFALACDFLKELGFQNFCKPDRHLKRILPALGLSDSSDDYTIFKAVVRMASNTDKTPYEVDKLFWLIGSGRFYDDDIKIGRQSAGFIRHAKKRLCA